jgi:hypothetical protein
MVHIAIRPHQQGRHDFDARFASGLDLILTGLDLILTGLDAKIDSGVD